MKKFLKLSLCFILFTSSINSTIKDSISSIINYGPHATWLGAAIYASYQYFLIEDKIKKQCKEITDPIVLDFLKNECTLITDKPIKFYVGQNQKDYLDFPVLALPNNIILIDEFFYESWKNILTKENKNNESSEDNPLVKLEKDSLNIFKFLVQRTAAQIKNSNAKWNFIKSLCYTAIKMTTFELVKKHFKNDIVTIGTSLGLDLFESLVKHFDNKRQENKTDMEIKTTDALDGGIQVVNNIADSKQRKLDKIAQIISSIINQPEENRLNKLAEKLLELEKNNK